MPLPESSVFIDYSNTHAALSRTDGDAANHFGGAPERWLPVVLDAAGVSGSPPYEGVCYLAPDASEEHRSAFEAVGLEVKVVPLASLSVRLSVDALVMDLAPSVVFVGWPATYCPVLEEIAADGGEQPLIAAFPLGGATLHEPADATFRCFSAVSAFERSLGRPLKTSKQPHPSPTAAVSPDLLVKIGKRIESEARETGSLAAGVLPGLYKQFPDFAADSNWLGYRGLLPLTRAILEAYPGTLEITGEGNDWKIAYTAGASPTRAEGPAPVPDRLREIHGWLGDHLVRQPAPVPAANAASLLTGQFGDHLVDSGWLGHRSFRTFIQTADDPRIAFSIVGPGYLYSPGLHADPAETADYDAFAATAPDLARAARKLNKEHGVPYLPPSTYGIIFRAISEELKESPFSLGNTSRGARDRCPELGAAVPRSAINTVVKMILTTSHQFGQGRDTPEVLAAAFQAAIDKLDPGDDLAETVEELVTSGL